MNGIQLKAAARYKRASFDGDEISAGAGQMVGDGAVNVSPTLEGSTTTLNVGHDPSRPSLSLSGVAFRKGGLWNRTSLTERALLTLVALLLSTIALLLWIGTFRPYGDASRSLHEPQRVCLTPECVKVASSIMSAMDSKADPCDDFYQYACGGWIRQNPLPDGKSVWGTFGKLWHENQLIMKNIIEDNTKPQVSRAEKLAKTYYLSCLDPKGTIEELGIAPIEDLIKKLGGWNLSTAGFEPSTWELQEVIETAQNVYTKNIFFEWSVTPDEQNSSRHIIALDQSGLTLPSRDYYVNDTNQDKALNALLQYFTNVGILMGNEMETAKAQANSVIEFELGLANIFIPELERRNEKALYNRMTIVELQKLSPFLDWLSFFRRGFSQVNITIDSATEVVVLVPSFFQNLSSIINNTLAEPGGKTILANYVGFQTVNSLIFALAAEFRNALRVVQRVLKGTEGMEATWRACISDTDQVLGFALGSMFIRHAFDEKSKQVAQSMVDQVKTAFKDNLPRLHWMDDATRALAKDKADHVTDMIAYPDFLTIPEKLDEKYVGLELKDNAYFENNIKISQWMLKRTMKKLTVAPRRGEWEMSPIQVNAYYTPSKNQIVFPAGILQAPFYHTNFPRSLNFGAMGVVMGHELTHALDDQGRQYDKEGNLKQWWNNRTIDAFTKQAQCFEDQYSKYVINNEQVNGKITLGENIADNGGLKAAFNAYRSWVKSNTELPPLPGVNLTHEQLFYVGFAQVWCSTETPEERHNQLLTDGHSPPRYRVIGTLSNSVEFARTYKCGESSKMNPQKKCELW